MASMTASRIADGKWLHEELDVVCLQR